jgi:hypothetical protein
VTRRLALGSLAVGIMLGASGVAVFSSTITNVNAKVTCEQCPEGTISRATKVRLFWTPDGYTPVALFCLDGRRFAETMTPSQLVRVPEEDAKCLE